MNLCWQSNVTELNFTAVQLWTTQLLSQDFPVVNKGMINKILFSLDIYNYNEFTYLLITDTGQIQQKARIKIRSLTRYD